MNVLGGPLLTCSDRPLTGFFRDGCCNTSEEDLGSHTICVLLTAEFLEFSKARGGGQKFFATAGGKNIQGISAAIQMGKKVILEYIGVTA